MPLPQRFHARCFDPTGRWSGRLRVGLDSSLWRVVTADAFNELLSEQSGSAGASPSRVGDSPALLLCVLDDNNAAEAARWWSANRARGNPCSPLVVVVPTADAGAVAYWQELGAAAVLTTTLELPLVLRLAERFAADPHHLAADLADPLTPFWETLPWADALPKAGLAG